MRLFLAWFTGFSWMLLGVSALSVSAAPEPSSGPVVTWNFDDSKEPGPRAPVYPGFSKTNTAGVADGKSALLTVPDGNQAPRFTKGEAITLEGWFKVRSLGKGAHVYLLGKGRTKGNTMNQNYALRLRGETSEGRLNFLFSSAASAGKAAGWHRWTSESGFRLGGWHHVAVTYVFGEPKSIRGYIDGLPVKGTWDMDGETDQGPVSDDDALILGSGNGNSKGNAFDGWMDSVAIWREALPEATLKSRYRFVPPPPAVTVKDVVPGKIRMQICEAGLPTTNAWPDEPLAATESYDEEAFGFSEVPQKYVATGVRGDRANPYLLRAASLVSLPKGTHRLLLRGHGAVRLFVDGASVLSLPFSGADGSGHGRISSQSEYLNLGPDFRFAPPGTRESTVEFQSPGREHFVVLETVVGGYLGKNKRRPELGETVLAWSREGTESWELLTPSGKPGIPYTDAGWENYEADQKTELAVANAKARESLRQSQSAYWEKRRAAALDWLRQTAEEPVPPATEDKASPHPIDRFLAAKISHFTAEANAAKTGSVSYHDQIRPILESKCYDCHQGSKSKGGLQLTSLAFARKGGKSGDPGLVPGNDASGEILARIASDDPDEIMPPKGTPLSLKEVALIKTWIKEGAHWPELMVESTRLTPPTDDLAFLRRVMLDTVGVVPSLAEIDAFLADSAPDKRSRWIDRLLQDSRWPDHWMGYWQDVLAENPNILNPTLNNTGPFRWWIQESLLDNKPLDLFVTELVRMEGSERFGGPAGFGVASQNDVPMAAKGTIVGSAFLGVQLKCARCHDAPTNRFRQEDLFHVAAMLGEKTMTVPTTSSVPMDRFHNIGRKPLITVTLAPGSKVEPQWPFPEYCSENRAKELAQHPEDPRDRLAAAVTAPENERFAQVMANRIWARFMGRGLVEPVDDWEKGTPTHPGLLRWLGRELVRGGYDTKHVARLILNCEAYQRSVDPALKKPSPLYTAPAPRRLSAEQIVDSLYAATGKPMRLEEVSLDIDGSRDLGNSISLGQPSRSWMLTSTSNERDRPSLSLPRIQAVADVLGAFGWRGSRQDPTTVRESDPNSLQPAILSNGNLGTWLTGLSDDHGITALTLEDQTLDVLIDRIFLKLLTRHPSPEEKTYYADYLREGYATRLLSPSSIEKTPSYPRERAKYVSWSNHLDPEATLVRQAQEADARHGDPPTGLLADPWRRRMEDVLWSLLNAPEFLFSP